MQLTNSYKNALLSQLYCTVPYINCLSAIMDVSNENHEVKDDFMHNKCGFLLNYRTHFYYCNYFRVIKQTCA